MIKKDIVDKVAEVVEIPRLKAQQTVDLIFDEMRESLLRDEKIELRGFGIFEIKPRKTGVGRNPKTGDTVEIKPGKKVKFRPGKKFTDL